jgi:hypothetical protein
MEIVDRIRDMKPWTKCITGAEHFDVYNDLLLAVHPPMGPCYLEYKRGVRCARLLLQIMILED